MLKMSKLEIFINIFYNSRTLYMKKILKIWQITLIALFLVIGLFILTKYFALDGTLKTSYDFSHKPTLISEITPSGRASDRQKNLTTKETYQSLSGDPVYFTAEAPRSYDSVEVSIKYNNSAQSIIELGLNKSIDWNYELKPLENKFIDDSTWERLDQDEIILLQKEKNYNSVEDFLNNLPLDKRIATYNYQLPYNFKLENYQPTEDLSAGALAQEEELVINKKLRGKHEFYTYIKDEDLDFTFTYQDINTWFNRDDFKVEVYSGDSQIHSDFVSDDGIEIASKEVSEVKEKNILLTDLPEGLYKISLPVTDDIIINQIKTKQNKLVVKNNLYLYLQEEVSEIYTEGDEFLFKAEDPEGLQSVTIKDQQLEINEVGDWFTWEDTDGALDDFKTLSIPKNNLYFKTKGYYAFDQSSYFDPDYLVDYLEHDFNIEDYDYLIAANYTSPEKETRYKVATQSFSLDQVPGDRKTLNFIISLPGLEDINDDVLIKEINLKFTRPSIIEKIKQKLK